MLEFIWKAIVILTFLAGCIAIIVAYLVWVAPRVERFIELQFYRRPRMVSIIIGCAFFSAWLLLGYGGFIHSPKDTDDIVAQWGARIGFIGIPVLILYGVISTMTFKRKSSIR
jgi:hypothetical protein